MDQFEEKEVPALDSLIDYRYNRRTMAAELKEYSAGEVNELLSHCEYNECEQDNHGQIIFYSGIFEWQDGTFHNLPDPSITP